MQKSFAVFIRFSSYITFLLSQGAGGRKLKTRGSRFILSFRTKNSLTLRAAFLIRSRDAKFLSRFFNT